MAPTYSRSGDAAEEAVTFPIGTASKSLSQNGSKPDAASLPHQETGTAHVMAAKTKTVADFDEKQQRSSNKGARKVILLSRHGESENNFSGKIGGDTNLSSRGRAYAAALASYINSLDIQCPVEVWTSGLKRTIATAAGVKCNQRKAMKELNELHAGCCEGMSYEEIQIKYPLEFAMRDQNKLTYKYPNGESYEDVLARVGPVIGNIEATTATPQRSENDEQKVLLIVSHQAVLRCFLSHFLDIAESELPYIEVPLHTVIWLMQDEETGKWSVSYVRLPVDCVDTFRPKPQNCNLQRSESDALETVPTHY
ncbi:6-phosphofructo-2-kinase/fructose-2,6-bisphosphatase [Orchesella cincta]|uniref:6-phosphofructo-2-kinase/fructose-2, 6-bisphosphatase n=1 Tax=Orchesella cincta TaxID=48709 RepID=A0A1D2NMG4_ORCCI|nr:6-phosphofructo-2-kinase/fructose-2,6-bisphosphatase [Orchesella cincta]